jgi:hypothetical protein
LLPFFKSVCQLQKKDFRRKKKDLTSKNKRRKLLKPENRIWAIITSFSFLLYIFELFIIVGIYLKMVDCFHVFAVLLRILCIVACITIGAISILIIIFTITGWPAPENDNGWNFIGRFFFLVIRIFVVIISIVVLLAELEWHWIYDTFRFLKSFIGRGLILLFLGCLTLAALYGITITSDNWLNILIVIAGWLCVVIGIIYIFAGCCCGSKLQEKRYRASEN